STLPLAACLWAGEQGRLRDFKHALYEAFFCEGEDIATDRELARAARRVELDPDGAVAAAYSAERFERIREIRREAEAAGVRGVPEGLSPRHGELRHVWGLAPDVAVSAELEHVGDAPLRLAVDLPHQLEAARVVDGRQVGVKGRAVAPVATSRTASPSTSSAAVSTPSGRVG